MSSMIMIICKDINKIKVSRLTAEDINCLKIPNFLAYSSSDVPSGKFNDAKKFLTTTSNSESSSILQSSFSCVFNTAIKKCNILVYHAEYYY